MIKKKLLLLIVPALLLVSCTTTKSVRSQRNLFSGTWALDNIRYENNTGNFQAVLFNDAKDICFEGSEWFFRDNNSTGRYTIKQGSLCTGGIRRIRWSVIEPQQNYGSQLQFKFIDDNYKDISGGIGYRLNITSLSEQQMVLKSNAEVDGELVTIVYEFSRK
ncbi:MAG: lipocalin family protein [Bacteroidota bacterium]